MLFQRLTRVPDAENKHMCQEVDKLVIEAQVQICPLQTGMLYIMIWVRGC